MRFLRELSSKVTWERAGAGFFLIFLLLTPLTYKIQLRAGLYQEGIYVEPLMPFLVLSVVLFLWSFWRKSRKDFWTQVRDFFIPHPIAKVFYFLVAVLALSWIYGVVLTGNFAWGDLLRLVKYGLYFLIFPISVRSGKVLGERWVYRILAALFLVGIGASAVSLYRIYQFVAAGNVIDFWQYSINSHSVGFLGQYLDLKTFTVAQIPKAAHATFGLYLSVILGIGLALFAQVWRVLFRIPVLAGIGVIFVALLFTLSRGAIVTGGLVILFGIVWLVRQKRFWALLVLTAFLFLETAVLVRLNSEIYQKFVSTFSGSQPVVTRPFEATSAVGEEVLRLWQGVWPLPLGKGPAEILSLGVNRKETAPPPLSGTTLDKSLSDRVLAWEEVWTLLNSRPLFFFLGVGYSIDNLRYFTSGEVVYPHSLFLDLWVRGGLLAVILVSIIWLLLFAKVLQFWFSKEGLVAALGTVLLGFLTGWFLDNAISGEQFFSDAPMLAFWGTLGLVQALAQVKSKKSNVKVLVALTSSDVGGAPQVVYDLLSHLPKAVNRQQLTGNSKLEFIVAAPAGGVFNKRFRDLGYRVYPAPLNKIGVRGLVELYRIARKEQIDLISSHGKGAGLYTRLVGTILGLPVVNTIHGIHYSKTNFISRNVYFISERFLGSFTRLVINVSKNQEKQGLALKLFPKSKSRVVENGIDLEKVESKRPIKNFRSRLGLEPNDFVATMVARFDPPGVKHKGHGRFINLLPEVIKKVPNLKVIFVGGGAGEKAIRRLGKKLGVSENTIFLGERNDVPRILAASDALVLPSYHEGLPLAPLEAAAAGLPVIGSDVVGIRDVVKDGETGFLVNFENKAEVTKAFRQLGRNKALRSRMGKRGREFVKKEFSMEKFVTKTLEVYEEALAEINPD